MPRQYLHSLTSPIRTARANLHLGAYLAFVAGAINAGGFLAISRYTSHMTGIVSSMADEFVLGNAAAVASGAALLAAFVAGSATTAILVNWGLRRQLHGAYSLPLMFEAVCLLLFGLVGFNIKVDASLAVSLTALILCFLMGLQNATITKISGAEIRTTHMTGIVTDIGIELGRLAFRNADLAANQRHVVKVNRQRLRINLGIFAMFLVGGICGALSFKHVGYVAVLPLALSLVLVSLLPVLRDMRGK
jgi:uncharacterized membrane protein YoaK (UPF0700 family)